MSFSYCSIGRITAVFLPPSSTIYCSAFITQATAISLEIFNAPEVNLSQARLVAKNILNERVADNYAVPITEIELQPVNIKENLVHVFNITGAINES